MAFTNGTSKSDNVRIRRGPMAVGRFTAALASAAFDKKGPIMAALLSDWPAIAGATVAGYTLPEKLTKSAPDMRAPAPDKRPAHLLLKVSPARALEVQYMIPQLIERINQALGYRAVNAIRLVQAPIKPSVTKPAKKPLAIQISEGASRLDVALARLAAGVKSRS